MGKAKPSTIFQTFNAVPCSSQKFFTENMYNLTSNLIAVPEDYYCLDRNITDIKNLEGSFGMSKFIIWSVKANICVNSTLNNNHCKPREEINKFLGIFYIHILMPDIYIDSKDIDKPIKERFTSKLFRVSPVNQRRDYLYYRIIDYYSDESIMLQSQDYRKSFILSRMETDCLYDLNTSNILEATISIDLIRTKIERSYTKIQKIAADIGGFIKLCNIVLSFISLKYSRLHFYAYLHSYFVKHKPNQQNQSINTKLPYENTINKDITLKSFNQNVLKINNLISSKNNIKETKVFNYSLLAFIKYYLCCFKSDYEKLKLKRIKAYVDSTYSFENIITLHEENLYIKTLLYQEKTIEFDDLIKSTIFNKFDNSIINIIKQGMNKDFIADRVTLVHDKKKIFNEKGKY